MKLVRNLSVLIFVLMPVTAFAHGGVSKNIGNAVVILNQSPLSPFVGEKVQMAFTITDTKLVAIPNLGLELTLTDTYFGDAAKDKLVETQQLRTDANGTFVFDYVFPNSDYHDVEVNFKDPVTGEMDQTGFLVQPRSVETRSVWPIIGIAVFTFILGFLVGKRGIMKAKGKMNE